MSGDGTLDLFEESFEPDEVSGGEGEAAPGAVTEDPAPDAGEEDGGRPSEPEEAHRTESSGEAPEAGREPEDAGEGPRVWTVSQVNRAVRNLLEDTIPAMWVGGEIGSWKRARSGHCYFTLKDEEAQLRCVMWRRDAEKLPTEPEEGMQVRAFGYLTLYEARGEYQLSVQRMEGEGEEGLWRLAFERLRKKLEAEGLLAPERKRPVPRFPEVVGVVTSPTGAALRDILTVIRRRAPWTRVVLRGTRVQGDGASSEIASAVRALASSGLCQVLIVGRGGGSLEDLWAFNEEPVARALAECPVPVISAVGHEVDVTIADLVADLRAPTPSAAAEAAVQDRAAILEVLDRARPRLARGLRHWLERRRRALQEADEAMARAVRGLVDRRRQRLQALAGKVEALSPLSTLRRGYAVPLDREGRLLRSAGAFQRGTEFDLRVVDGRIRCETLEVRETDEPGGAER